MHFNRQKVAGPKLKIAPKGRSKKKSSSKVKKQDIRPVSKPKTKKKSIRMRTRPVGKIKANERKMYKSLSDWQDLLTGHTAFLLGNAPSISSQRLSLLDKYFTIGVNRIFYLYDPTVLLWQDRQLWNGDKKVILKQNAIRVCSNTADPRNAFLNFRVKLGPFRFGRNPSLLFGMGNTTALAAELAVSLGCSNLVLVGTDCKYGAKGKTDFYGKNKDHKPYTLKMCNAAMKWLKEECPVPIYNCSDNKLWPSEELSDVINKIKPHAMGREKYKQLLGK